MAASATARPLVSIVNFYVYNPDFGTTEETEEEKLLYYYPRDTPIDTKIKHVGLSEALVKFTSTFSEAQPCEIVRTLKTRQSFLNPEGNFWAVLTLTVPTVARQNKDGDAIAYEDEDLHDIIVRNQLLQLYRTFKLLNGSLTYILESFNLKTVRDKLDSFYSQHLPSLRVDPLEVQSTFGGIHFLPLDRNSYLRIQCFIAQTESNLPQIVHTVFLYGDHLVYSGLEQDDMRIIYRYLTSAGFLTPLFSDQPASTRTSASPMPAHVRTGFLIGPENPSDSESPINSPRVYVDGRSESDPLHLVMYHIAGACLCCLVEARVVTDLSFYRRFEAAVNAPLRSIATQVAEQTVQRKNVTTEPQYRYVYFNHMNLALKTSAMTGRARALMAPEVMRTITDMHADFEKKDSGEIIVKGLSDTWVIGKKSEQREVFVVITQKNANLIEINDEVNKLNAAYFNNIFMD
eukprot:Opistho-2@85591